MWSQKDQLMIIHFLLVEMLCYLLHAINLHLIIIFMLDGGHRDQQKDIIEYMTLQINVAHLNFLPQLLQNLLLEIFLDLY